MDAVTAKTKRDNPKIDLAGVEAGAKMFVGLRAGVAGPVAPAAATNQRTTEST
jgi:hypothetical protein